MHEPLRPITDRARAEEEAALERRAAASHAHLAEVLTKRFLTAGVGAVARVEEHFGHLWGFGLDAADCTPAQLALRPLWELLRTAVLDHAHAQSRAARNELRHYRVLWQTHRVEFRRPFDYPDRFPQPRDRGP